MEEMINATVIKLDKVRHLIFIGREIHLKNHVRFEKRNLKKIDLQIHSVCCYQFLSQNRFLYVFWSFALSGCYFSLF